MNLLGTSLAAQWLRLRASTAGGLGSIPGQGTKMLQAMLFRQKKKKNLLGEEHFPFQPDAAITLVWGYLGEAAVA